MASIQGHTRSHIELVCKIGFLKRLRGLTQLIQFIYPSFLDFGVLIPKNGGNSYVLQTLLLLRAQQGWQIVNLFLP